MNRSKPGNKFADWISDVSGASVVEHLLIVALVVSSLLSVSMMLHLETLVPNPLSADAGAPAAAPNRVLPSPGVTPPAQTPLVMRVVITGCTLLVTGLMITAILLRKKKKEAVDPQPAPNSDSGAVVKINGKTFVFSKRQTLLNALARDLPGFLECKVTVRDLMTKKPISVRPDTPVSEVKNKMRTKRLRHVLVCDAAGEVVGIISDRDIRSAANKDGCADTIMTADPIRVRADSPVNPAITTMIEHSISCLPVVDQKGLCGVLTVTDLMLALQCTLQILKKVDTAATAEATSEERAGREELVGSTEYNSAPAPTSGGNGEARRTDPRVPCESGA